MKCMSADTFTLRIYQKYEWNWNITTTTKKHRKWNENNKKRKNSGEANIEKAKKPQKKESRQWNEGE